MFCPLLYVVKRCHFGQVTAAHVESWVDSLSKGRELNQLFDADEEEFGEEQGHAPSLLNIWAIMYQARTLREIYSRVEES